MTRRSPREVSEIAQLRARHLYTIDVMDRAQPAARWAALREVVEDAVARAALRDLRALGRELTALAGALPPAAQAELRSGLRARFGANADAERQEEAAAVARIRKRGQIRSAREYRLVRGYADRIAGEAAAEDELRALRALLDPFGAAP